MLCHPKCEASPLWPRLFDFDPACLHLRVLAHLHPFASLESEQNWIWVAPCLVCLPRNTRMQPLGSCSSTQILAHSFLRFLPGLFCGLYWLTFENNKPGCSRWRHRVVRGNVSACDVHPRPTQTSVVREWYVQSVSTARATTGTVRLNVDVIGTVR